MFFFNLIAIPNSISIPSKFTTSNLSNSNSNSPTSSSSSSPESTSSHFPSTSSNSSSTSTSPTLNSNSSFASSTFSEELEEEEEEDNFSSTPSALNKHTFYAPKSLADRKKLNLTTKSRLDSNSNSRNSKSSLIALATARRLEDLKWEKITAGGCFELNLQQEDLRRV